MSVTDSGAEAPISAHELAERHATSRRFAALAGAGLGGAEGAPDGVLRLVDGLPVRIYTLLPAASYGSFYLGALPDSLT